MRTLRTLFLLLVLTLSVACKEKKPQLVSDPITGAHIVVPRDFRVGPILKGNDEANSLLKLQASNVFKDIGVGVVMESKEDIAEKLTLDRYIEIASENRAKNIKNAARSEHVARTVDGLPGVQETVRGAAGTGNVVYMILYLESPTHFYQVTAWTAPSRLTANRAVMQSILDSFGVTPTGSQ
ncbi:MAG: hypothetical protein U0174_19880 [Polyangiaceae bacterium]